MRKATLDVTTYEVTCPHCEVQTTDPKYNRYSWIANEHHHNEVNECSECNKKFQLPKVVAFNRV